MLAKCVAGEVPFLDEFGDLALEAQIKLLRVVEDRKYTPVATTEERALCGTLVFAAQPAWTEAMSSAQRRLRHGSLRAGDAGPVVPLEGMG